MSIAPFRGKCWVCGHDHDRYWTHQPVPVFEPTSSFVVDDGMVEAYTTAADKFWREVNDRPITEGIVKNGTHHEAIKAGLIAAIEYQKNNAR